MPAAFFSPTGQSHGSPFPFPFYCTHWALQHIKCGPLLWGITRRVEGGRWSLMSSACRPFSPFAEIPRLAGGGGVQGSLLALHCKMPEPNLQLQGTAGAITSQDNMYRT